MSRDRRTIFLGYKQVVEGGYVANHWCTPGLAGAVRKYISETYGVQPRRTERHRYMRLDPGGMVVLDPNIVVPMDGFRVKVRPCHIPDVVIQMEDRIQRPPKVYGDIETFRLGGMYYNLIMRTQEMVHLLGILRPHLSSCAQANAIKRAELNALPHVQIGPTPTPAEG